MDFLDKLGIDYRLIIAQVVNFAILLFVLHRFAYKPILKVLAERRERIERSQKDAAALEERISKGEEERRERLNQAQQEADLIVSEARQQAETMREKMLEAAKAEVSAAMLEAASEARELKERALAEARVEVAGLVVDATEKILGEKLTEKRDRDFIERTIHELKP